jgi:REP element-mobilizing transposase RayT
MMDIFHDDEDRDVFVDKLLHFKMSMGYAVFAYAVMPNHVHLLLQEGPFPISEVMKRLSTSYTHHYNMKYERDGSLFHDRFKSEPVETDEAMKLALQNIHQNPVREGRPIHDYTSFSDYESVPIHCDVLPIFDMFAYDDPAQARELFLSFVATPTEETGMEVERYRMSDAQATKRVQELSELADITAMRTLHRGRRKKIFRQLKAEGCSIRQLERLTGIGRGSIFNA